MSVIDWAIARVFNDGKQARADLLPRKVPKKLRSPTLRDSWLSGWDTKDKELLKMAGHQ